MRCERVRSPWVGIVAMVLSAAPGRLNAAEAPSTQSGRPNVLFLFTDDQRPDGVGALGNPILKTPAMDSLAREGFVFRNAYCFGSNSPAVCRPSRNMLLSGRSYFRWSGRYAPADQPNIPVALKTAGYFTYHHGKKGNVARLIHEEFDISKYVNDQKARQQGEPGHFIIDEAITFLKQRRDDKPFFMYLAFADPHDPRIAAQKYLDLYEPGKIPLPKNYLPQHPFDNGELLIRDERLAPWPRLPEEIRRHLHEYYAVISGLDHHIGRLLHALKKLGLYDNTVILFSSDNGLALGSHGLMGKQSLYEHSAKVPLVIAGPGIPRGSSEALVYLMDLFPTICQLADAPVPPNLDGKSLKAVMEGKAPGVRETVFLSYRNVQRALRDPRWKLIRYPHINKTQLFDLQRDPDELRNLADDAAQSARIERMTAQLKEWQKQLGDTLPLTCPNPRDATGKVDREGESNPNPTGTGKHKKGIKGGGAGERIKAFCVDFNWGPGGPNGFAAPGVYAKADPKVHLKWYKALGVNTIQTFCVNCCGYAWYKDSKVAPVQPGLAHDFLKELTERAHADGMKVMGYFCVGANTYWGRTHPDLSYGTPSHPHIPLTTQYLDYLCASIKDALMRTKIDGFMIDWVFNLSYRPGARSKWLACEQEMYKELMGEPFPGKDKIDEKREIEFHRRAVERCWTRIRKAAKSRRPDCVIWLSCHDLSHPQVAGSKMFREVDWLMNEHPDPVRLEAVRKTAGPRTRIIQCLCGWGAKHDAAKVTRDPRFADVGFYGFAWPDAKTTLPPTLEQAGDNERLVGNARNIEALRMVFHRAGAARGSSSATITD